MQEKTVGNIRPKGMLSSPYLISSAKLLFDGHEPTVPGGHVRPESLEGEIQLKLYLSRSAVRPKQPPA